MKPVSPLGPRTLTGRFIALEPLEPRHHTGLIRAAEDPSLWQHIPIDPEKGYAARLAWLQEQEDKRAMHVFTVRRLKDGAIVGGTSYLNIVPHDAKVEIGFTWYAAEAQGGAVNPEAKYLLLKNAFEAGYNRVEFKTGSKNSRSRAALKKLGAKEEGILRGHMWMPQGYFRDSVYFSILAGEWPEVKAQLEARLEAFS
jgi:RimJ/RimL family protein N-acetyltransferase